MNHSAIVSFLWSVADLIRDSFKRGKYQDVILPLTVLRRLACVLAPTKERVLETDAKLRKTELQDLRPQLRKASGFGFYNTSRYDFEKLLADPPNLAENLRHYIAGFSENMREVLEKFDFDNTSKGQWARGRGSPGLHTGDLDIQRLICTPLNCKRRPFYGVGTAKPMPVPVTSRSTVLHTSL